MTDGELSRTVGAGALHFTEGRGVPGNKNYQDSTVNSKNQFKKRTEKTNAPGQYKDTVGGKGEVTL